MGQLLQTRLLKPGDLDPLGRHLKVGEHRFPVVQVALLAEDKALRDKLSTYGLPTQVLAEIDPVQVYPAGELVFDLCRNWPQPKAQPERTPGAATPEPDHLPHFSHTGRCSGLPALFLRSAAILPDAGLPLPGGPNSQRTRLYLRPLARAGASHGHHHADPRDVPKLGRNPIHESPLLALMKELLGGTVRPCAGKKLVPCTS